jgi:hypothetical protein
MGVSVEMMIEIGPNMTVLIYSVIALVVVAYAIIFWIKNGSRVVEPPNQGP